jgi:hypothetical protein
VQRESLTVIKGDVGEGETNEVNDLPGQSDTGRNDNRPLSVPTNRDANANTMPASILPDDSATPVSYQTIISQVKITHTNSLLRD